MIDLKEYGWQDDFKMSDSPNLIPARVLESHREIYTLVCAHGEITARLKGSFYNNLGDDPCVPVVGDFVMIQYNSSGVSLIVQVLSRKSQFSRTDFSGHAAGYVKTMKEQVIAVNFDYVFIMISLNHDFNLNRIERYLSIALQSRATPVIVLTKADSNDAYEAHVEEVKRFTGCENVFAISAKTGFGLDALRPFFMNGKTLAFIGSSGVGKSTLVNVMAGEEVMKVNAIRETDSKGRHTTTSRQLIKLASGAMIIDTPGLRELGLFDVSEGLGIAFSDVEALIDTCKYADCRHENEPGCAIREALQKRTLSTERWQLYNQLHSENEWGKSKVPLTKRERLKEKMRKK
jgi:ribosome biogenesis GTPase